MPTITAITHEGKKGASVSLPAALFAAKVNLPLMAQAVRVYLSNQRQSPAKTKSRSEVSLTTRKMYKQKGTGRARHGAQSAPIFVGGGVAHGPQGTQNYQLSMPQKMRRRSVASALTNKLQTEQIKVVSQLDKLDSKVKAAANLLKIIELNDKKVTVVLAQKVPALVKTWRNLPNVSITYANLLNTYEVLNGGILLVDEQAITVMEHTFAVQGKTKAKSPAQSAAAAKPEKKATVKQTTSVKEKAQKETSVKPKITKKSTTTAEKSTKKTTKTVKK